MRKLTVSVHWRLSLGLNQAIRFIHRPLESKLWRYQVDSYLSVGSFFLVTSSFILRDGVYLVELCDAVCESNCEVDIYRVGEVNFCLRTLAQEVHVNLYAKTINRWFEKACIRVVVTEMDLGPDFSLRVVFFTVQRSRFVNNLFTSQHKKRHVEVLAFVDDKNLC